MQFPTGTKILQVFNLSWRGARRRFCSKKGRCLQKLNHICQSNLRIKNNGYDLTIGSVRVLLLALPLLFWHSVVQKRSLLLVESPRLVRFLLLKGLRRTGSFWIRLHHGPFFFQCFTRYMHHLDISGQKAPQRPLIPKTTPVEPDSITGDSCNFARNRPAELYVLDVVCSQLPKKLMRHIPKALLNGSLFRLAVVNTTRLWPVKPPVLSAPMCTTYSLVSLILQLLRSAGSNRGCIQSFWAGM